MNLKKEFFPFIHFLRGIAVLLVLWAHLCGWWLGVNNTTSKLQTYWANIVVNPLHLYQNGGHLGVLIFFLISGFIVTYVSEKEEVKEYIVKRFFRIVPTLAVALILMRVIIEVCQIYNLDVPYPICRTHMS